jgi:hypothetical protein
MGGAKAGFLTSIFLAPPEGALLHRQRRGWPTMKEVIVLGIVMGVAGLCEPALAQTLKSPEAIAAQVRAEAKPAGDGLVKLLESKGILSDTEAALVSDTQLQPQTKQVLAELLLSKHLITEKEYDRTIEACWGPAAQSSPSAPEGLGKAAEPRAARFMSQRRENGEPSGFKSFSDWISSILPGGVGNNYIDFGTLEPEPPGPDNAQGEPSQPRAKAKSRSREDHAKGAAHMAPGADTNAPRQ